MSEQDALSTVRDASLVGGNVANLTDAALDWCNWWKGHEDRQPVPELVGERK